MMKTRVFQLLVFLVFACSPADKPVEDRAEKNERKTSEIIDVVEYYPNGVVKLRGKSQGGKRIGRWESFYPNGYRWSEMEYRNGYRQGDVISYFSNGMMRYQGRFYNDERSGIWQFYDTTGVLIEKIDMDAPRESDVQFRTDSTGIH